MTTTPTKAPETKTSPTTPTPKGVEPGKIEVALFDPADMPQAPTDRPHPYSVIARHDTALDLVTYELFSDRFRSYLPVRKGDVLIKDNLGRFDVYKAIELVGGVARLEGMVAARMWSPSW
jgi:hypothetical protein